MPLTIQEALYPGAATKGIARKQDPVTVGVPLPDSAGIRDASELGLKGALVGQFRVLGRWPSGNVKWVLIDTQADVGAGAENSSIHVVNGRGDFGGPPLAADQGSAIVVNTGPAQFRVRKSNFNLFDSVVVDGKTVLAASSQGLVLSGPAPGETTCAAETPCTTMYSSSLDSASTATVEENGPVRAVIKSEGMHKDAAGHAYMKYTARIFFYKGKSWVKVQVSLRNADETNDLQGDYNSAAKGFASYELQLSPKLGAAKEFSIGSHTGSPVSGSLRDGDTYLYQAYSNDMEFGDWSAHNCKNRGEGCVVSYIKRSDHPPYVYQQDGFALVANHKVLLRGDHASYPQGWADLKDSTGAGIEIGVYQLAAYWPKSLEFRAGGSDVRIGIWPNQGLFPEGGGQPYYQSWPFYSIHDVWIDFHAAALDSPGNEFLKFQHYLIARASVEQYNRAGVFFEPLLDPGEEDNYYRSLGVRCCLPDVSPKVFRFYSWSNAGGGNQHDLRLSYLRNFLERGQPGRYLYAANFYRMVAEHGFPRSDGFQWRDHPIKQLNPAGYPEWIHSANGDLTMANWTERTWAHSHVYGIFDYYFLTGDEAAKDAILDGMSDRFLNLNVRDNSADLKLFSTRAVGSQLMAISRLSQFYDAIGDKQDAATALTVGERTLQKQVYPELNVSGYGEGLPKPGIEGSAGISRTRGVPYGCCDTESPDRAAGITEPTPRVAQAFQIGVMTEGLWEYLQVRGKSWSDYWKLSDLIYGLGEWFRNESVVDTGVPDTSGVIYCIYLDYPNENTFYWKKHGAGMTSWFNWFVVGAYTGDSSAWRREFELQLKKMDKAYPYPWAEADSHMVQATVDEIIHPAAEKLVDLPLTVKSNGAGSYTLSWTVPRGAELYRIKYMDDGKKIVNWLNFNPGTNTFAIDPQKNWPWFAAADAPAIPAPAKSGATQTYSFQGSAEKQYSFSGRAYVSAR